MPDVISDVHSISLSGVEDFMDEEQSVNGDPMLSHHLLNSPNSPRNHSNNNQHNFNMTNHNHNGSNPHLNHHMHHHNSNHNQQLTNNILGLDMNGDPMFSGSSSNSHSTVDLNCIDPIIADYTLLTNVQVSNCDSANVVDSILQSDTDSLVSDIDMVA